MSFKSKLDNFWYYYKNHTIMAIILIFIGLGLFFTTTENKKSDFNIVLFSVNDGFEGSDIKDELDDLIVVDKDKREVKISFLPYDMNDPNSQTSTMSMQALSVWIMAGDVDVFIANKDLIEQYSADNQGMDSSIFISLDEYKINSIKSIEDDFNNIIGLCLDDIPKLKNLNLYDKDLYISALSAGENRDKIDKVFKYFLNQ